MNQIQPHPFNPSQLTDTLHTAAVGGTIFVLLFILLDVALAIYFILMPLLIYIRLGRIARAAESADYTQKSILIELRESVALQRKLDGNASVQTTILKNLDQNLALGVNKVGGNS